ncbi:unnamed protein product [Clonostachys rhizophaga]|uniref:Tautomerase cis-CaaD-like domain-containing protein n=1 Tax=Clonostachys rhizophaga TaxID=160324 RepID=A0A9N9VSB4_9HYPO|nr:unnamed protein product [Clonostachys rhizophaga]
MPLYEIAHTIPLTDDQKDSLAAAITELHSSKFTVPRMFINVIFTNISNVPIYTGGKRTTASNRIVARVRRGSRSREDFNSLCSEIRTAWARIVHPAYGADQLPPAELELRAIFITGELLAGMKCEFHVPIAGAELEWAKAHYTEFQTRAAHGDQDFVGLVGEIDQWLHSSG